METAMSQGTTTTDHDTIRKWAEERDGRPASVAGTGSKGEPGILRIDFKPWDEKLEKISWEDFFEKFEEENLAFLYQEETASGGTSRFHKFVERSAQEKKSRSAA
jgi:hypothetical protein